MNVRSLHEITCVGNYACQHVGCANSFFVCAPFVYINGEQKTLAYPTWLQWLITSQFAPPLVISVLIAGIRSSSQPTYNVDWDVATETLKVFFLFPSLAKREAKIIILSQFRQRNPSNRSVENLDISANNISRTFIKSAISYASI